MPVIQLTAGGIDRPIVVAISRGQSCWVWPLMAAPTQALPPVRVITPSIPHMKRWKTLSPTVPAVPALPLAWLQPDTGFVLVVVWAAADAAIKSSGALSASASAR